MHTDIVIYLMFFVGVLSGFIPTAVHYRRARIRTHQSHLTELHMADHDAWREGFDAGWDALAKNPIVIKKLCNDAYHTHSPR